MTLILVDAGFYFRGSHFVDEESMDRLYFFLYWGRRVSNLYSPTLPSSIKW
jgi:hypothetical protein